MTICVYPGSFDPLTNGHVDMISRAAKLFDRVIVAVLHNSEKKPMFSVEQRMRMIQAATGGLGNVEADAFGGLLAEYVKKRGAHVILRGVRGSVDLDYERQMADANAILYDGAETVLLLPRGEYACISSTIVRDVARYGGDVTPFVPQSVAEMIADAVASKSLEGSREE